MFAHSSKEFIVVSLEISRNDKNIRVYNKLSVEGKVKKIVDYIQAILEQFIDRPNANIIIAWREYGITGVGGRPDNRYINQDEKKLIKKEFLALCRSNPRLTIIAGTVAVRKETDLAHLNKIIKYYKPYEWIKNIEDRNIRTKEGFMRSHEQTILSLLQEENPSTDKKVTVVRNTCYVFRSPDNPQFKEADEIIRHDKWTPMFETIGKEVFQPAKGRNIALTFKVDNEVIGIEICREHSLGLLKRNMDEWDVSTKKPLIQFVISDSTPIDQIQAKYLIHLDSMEPFQLLMNDKMESEAGLSMEFYSANLLENDPKVLHKDPSIYRPPTQSK